MSESTVTESAHSALAKRFNLKRTSRRHYESEIMRSALPVNARHMIDIACQIV